MGDGCKAGGYSENSQTVGFQLMKIAELCAGDGHCEEAKHCAQAQGRARGMADLGA